MISQPIFTNLPYLPIDWVFWLQNNHLYSPSFSFLVPNTHLDPNIVSFIGQIPPTNLVVMGKSVNSAHAIGTPHGDPFSNSITCHRSCSNVARLRDVSAGYGFLRPSIC